MSQNNIKSWYIGQLKNAWRVLAVIAVMTVITAAIEIVPGLIGAWLMDTVLVPASTGRLDLKLLTVGCLAYLAVCWFEAGWAVIYEVYSEKTVYRLGQHLRRQVLEHTLTLGVEDVAKLRTGGVIATLTQSIGQVVNFVQVRMMNSAKSLALVATSFTALLVLSPKLAGVVACIVPPAFAVVYVLTARARVSLNAWMEQMGDSSNFLSEMIAGFKTVKAFGQEKAELAKYDAIARKEYGLVSKLSLTWMVGETATVLCVGLTVALTYWIAGQDLAEGKITVGVLMVLVNYITRIFNQLQYVAGTAQEASRTWGHAKKIFELVQTSPSVKSGNVEVSMNSEIEFTDVGFNYTADKQALSGVSLTVAPGEFLAIVGPSGSGKSTLISALANFIEPSSGSVKIGGVSLSEIDNNSLRSKMAVVSQDQHLFAASVLDNIRYGNPTASDEQVRQAAMAAQAHEFISALPKGYDTVLGERGHGLSGGEKQRIAIARAILMSPDILILDEATSALDGETEKLVKQAIDELAKGRTVIAVAHRLSTIEKADRVVKMVDGKILEITVN